MSEINMMKNIRKFLKHVQNAGGMEMCNIIVKPDGSVIKDGLAKLLRFDVKRKRAFWEVPGIDPDEPVTLVTDRILKISDNLWMPTYSKTTNADWLEWEQEYVPEVDLQAELDAFLNGGD